MKKIILSLALIAGVGAIVFGATTAYFSDTETSTGNTFSAGTVDIAVDGQNPWTEHFTLADMKPGYTDYINFDIQNDNSGANPVNVWKTIKVTDENSGTVTEPECTDQSGSWNGTTCDFSGANGDNNNLSSVIVYDLSVKVYNNNGDEIWNQTMYVDSQGKTLDDVYGTNGTYGPNGDVEVYLGMIPAHGHMEVTQSYHMADTAGNEFQGDSMTFDVTVRAEQLHGTAWLENKDANDSWRIKYGDGIKGTLTYKVKNPTFDYSFSGKAPLANHSYVLAMGYDSSTNVDTYLGQGTTDNNGDITISGNIELGKNMKDVKVWLVPAENWTGGATGQMVWSGYNPDNFLWEAGLIWYEDTDL